MNDLISSCIISSEKFSNLKKRRRSNSIMYGHAARVNKLYYIFSKFRLDTTFEGRGLEVRSGWTLIKF
jgi:hypothetical protein